MAIQWFSLSLSASSKKTDARANAQRLSRSAAVACFRCLFIAARLSFPGEKARDRLPPGRETALPFF